MTEKFWFISLKFVMMEDENGYRNERGRTGGKKT